MQVFVTGGTGLVGRALISRLADRGDVVTILSRSKPDTKRFPPNTHFVQGDPTQAGSWQEAIAACDAVVHLAGESIGGGRWRKRFKERVLESRVRSTTLIAETLAKLPDASRRTFLSASAVGYYGSFKNNPTEFVETDLPGHGFLADVCVAWEKGAEVAERAGVRVVHPRIGTVLARNGGALPKIAKPFQMRVGGVIGSGQQWMSWIHLDDLVGLLLLALDRSELRGPLNATSPEPVTNWGFSHTLAKVLDKPCWLHLPAWVLRGMLGEMSELATHGQRVRPAVAQRLGYEYRFPVLDQALQQIYSSEAK
jgi:uncharacterized protein (TIGR01777 family)